MTFLLIDQVEASIVESSALALNLHHPCTEWGDLHPYKGTSRATGKFPSPFQDEIANAAWNNSVHLPDQRGPWFSIPIAQESPQNSMLLSQRSTEQWGGNPISYCLLKDHIPKFWLYNPIDPGWFPTSL